MKNELNMIFANLQIYLINLLSNIILIQLHKYQKIQKILNFN